MSEALAPRIQQPEVVEDSRAAAEAVFGWLQRPARFETPLVTLPETALTRLGEMWGEEPEDILGAMTEVRDTIQQLQADGKLTLSAANIVQFRLAGHTDIAVKSIATT